ncbi:MAG TPA: protein YgfX [Telluria sp.]|nr:protein YgfX [Telluria sp.]
MPIAVSAIVAPSRLLRAALVLYAALQLGAGLAAAWALAAATGGPIAACCAAAAGAALRAWAGACTRTTRRIDISGVGELRLTVQLDLCAAPARGVPVRLAPGSTLWPQLLLLRLRAEDGALTVLAVLPDSVGPGQFRALAVALRAIAGRDNSFFGKNKIL